MNKYKKTSKKFPLKYLQPRKVHFVRFKIISLVFWKVSGADVMPCGSLLQKQRPKVAMNGVYFADSGSGGS